ncbi:MAG: metallophosphoesterase [Bacteroidetes bacterium]|jgi:hypothetical protein|nr:metallophosphoesterase [Bacteroidota bacterium]
MVQLTVFLPLVLLNIYAGGKLARALEAFARWPLSRARRIVYAVLAVLNALPLVAFLVYWLQGRRAMLWFSGESLWVDAVLVYPFWTILVILVQLAIVFLAWDFVGLVLRLIGKPDRDAWRRRTHAFSVWAWIVVSVYSIATIIADTSQARVDRLDVVLPVEAASLDGFRILQISDVQGDGRTTERKISRFIEQALALEPDLVLNGGDIVTGGTDYIASTARLLGKLTAPYGHICAVGDHDIFSDKSMVVTELRRNGIVVADDTSFVIDTDRGSIGLTLVTYTYRQRPDPATVDSLLNENGVPFRILLLHQPNKEIVENASADSIDLVLAGHTHGGGVAFGIPGIALLAPASFESPYVSGAYRVGHTVVNVTNGLGFTLAPIRFHAPLEMTLITLRAPGTNQR